ncbi:cation diffusion facilitator family transporter [Phaeovulum sp. W22_SRMD_FR3]
MTGQNEKLVFIGFLLTFGFMLAEAVGGVLSGSLALIADAGHMLTDAAALALAWAGFRFGRRQGDARRTFGYLRLEILAGFVNALALIILIGWITFAAVERLFDPQPVHSGPMMVIAVLGLLVNAGVLALLMRGDRGHLNIRGAMVHVMGDLLGSVAAIAAAVVIYVTGWTPIDPILSVLLSLLILRSSWLLLKNALQILMEGVPDGIALDDIRQHLRARVPGLDDVAHIHVWSITSGKPAATMEIRLTAGADPASCVAATKAALALGFGIAHSTVEIDWARTDPECPLAPAPA